VAVVGYDDIPEASFTAVPLTTVRQPIREYARHAVRMLRAQADEDQGFVPDPVVMECRLVVRRSTDINWRPQAAAG